MGNRNRYWGRFPHPIVVSFVLFFCILFTFTYFLQLSLVLILQGKPWLGGTQGDAPGEVNASPGGIEKMHGGKAEL